MLLYKYEKVGLKKLFYQILENYITLNPDLATNKFGVAMFKVMMVGQVDFLIYEILQTYNLEDREEYFYYWLNDWGSLEYCYQAYLQEQEKAGNKNVVRC